MQKYQVVLISLAVGGTAVAIVVVLALVLRRNRPFRSKRGPMSFFSGAKDYQVSGYADGSFYDDEDSSFYDPDKDIGPVIL